MGDEFVGDAAGVATDAGGIEFDAAVEALGGGRCGCGRRRCRLDGEGRRGALYIEEAALAVAGVGRD